MSKSIEVMRMRRACSRLLVLAALLAAAPGSAQVGTGTPWSLNGSDTLEQMVREAIVQATADGTLASVGKRCQTPNSLVARGFCSVTATQQCSTTSGGAACPVGETCVAAATQACTAAPDECPGFHPLALCKDTSELFYAGGGSTTGETALRNNVQTIAPMSRNFRNTVIYTSSAATTRRGFCSVTVTQECSATLPPCPGTETCQPRFWDALGNRPVVALDAGVIVTKSSASSIKNFDLPIVGQDESKTAPNVDPGNYFPLRYGTGYTNLLQVVLSGIDGTGSFAACSNPRRMNAVQDLALLQGMDPQTLSHFFRRDDNSGTTDTFKEKLNVRGFCNGRAVGILGANKSSPNLNNQDNDPIRRPCQDFPGGRQTACTDMTTVPPTPCTPADALTNPNCTQGLVVALSVGDNDTDLADVTTTIGYRVNTDQNAMGFAGREAVQQATLLVAGPNIRTRSPDNTSVRLGIYMLARRLFINFADADGDPGTDVTSLTLAGSGANAAPRIDAERRLWNWISAPGGAGRCRFDPIVKGKGFVTCSDECADDPDNLPGNICGGTAPVFGGSPSLCVPSAVQWPVGTPSGGTCNPATAGEICCSTGSACPASGICPAVGQLPANSPCAANSDCLNGLCSDSAFIGTTICN
jgi:hypothetical protein